MTTAINEATTLPLVGQRATEYHHFAQFPIGTVLRREDDNSTHTRVEGGYESTAEGARTRRATDYSPFAYIYTVESLPTDEPLSEPTPEFTEGQTITDLAMVEALPVGTEVNLQYGSGQKITNDPFVKREGHFKFLSTRTGEFSTGEHAFQSFANGEWYIQSLPGASNIEAPVTEPEPTPEPEPQPQPIEGQETLRQYVERVRTIIRSATLGTDKSTQIDRVDNAFAAMGHGERDITHGTLLDGGETDVIGELPDGTVVTINDEHWIKSSFGWYTVEGRIRYLSRGTLYKVTHRPGGWSVDWASEVGTSRDVAAIEAFNEQVLEVAQTLKRDHGWCEVVDETLVSLDLEVEVEDEEVEVEVTIEGTSTGYWDSEFQDILGGDVVVDNPHITVHWKKEVTITKTVPQASCACDEVTTEDLEYYVEDISDVNGYEVGSTSCPNC